MAQPTLALRNEKRILGRRMAMNLKKISICAAGALVTYALLAAGFAVYNTFASHQNGAASPAETAVTKNSHDGTYIIGGQKITLVNGLSEIEAAPGSATKIVTHYFGNDVAADFDLDGRQDLAFVVSQDTGGSGVFYYVVALLNKVSGPIGTQGALLGDRIAPQSLEQSGKNTLIANFAERKAHESFDTPPSVGRSVYLRLDSKTGVLEDVTARQ